MLGESFASKPNIFDEAKTKLKNEIIHFGYCDNHWDYAKWLCSADILPVTNNQDFFGASIVEAIYCGAFPLLQIGYLIQSFCLPNSIKCTCMAMKKS